MKHIISRGLALASLILLGLGAGTLLTGCDKRHHDCDGPNGSVCNTAATVVDLSTTTGCGLALQLANGTYVVPTGATWTDFHATVGEKVLVGYALKKNDHDADDQNACPAGPLAKVGCISVPAPSTATATKVGGN